MTRNQGMYIMYANFYNLTCFRWFLVISEGLTSNMGKGGGPELKLQKKCTSAVSGRAEGKQQEKA